jgi:hypothetical protein
MEHAQKKEIINDHFKNMKKYNKTTSLPLPTPAPPVSVGPPFPLRDVMLASLMRLLQKRRSKLWWINYK